MNRFALGDLPEAFFSTTATSAKVSRAVSAGKLRKLGPRLYTSNLSEEPAALVRRHLWDIVAGYFPDGLVADRTALELGPATDGSVFLAADRTSTIPLPGLTLRARRGAARHPTDFPLRDNLSCMAAARALLENMRPTRARSGVARTLRRSEIEAWLERFLRDSGEDRLNAMRDQIKDIAPALKLTGLARELDDIIGTLLGTRDAPLSSPTAKARARGAAFDPRRIELFEVLHDALRRLPPEPARPWHPANAAAINQAFFEAYFSNFIEGTEFSVKQAEDIVFNGTIPKERPADAHDVLGTFRLVSNAAEMRRLPDSPEQLLDLLRRRHNMVMGGRPESAPGMFKQRANQFGSLVFVAPEDVVGTLTEGFRIYRRLVEPMHRAIFMMFFVSEVHPFVDGNGRVARIMMNAELAAAGQVRIIIPIIYRYNYISALRALSANAQPEAIIKTLAFAQRYTAAIRWDDMATAINALTHTNAFVRPEDAEQQGIRLRMPDPADLALEPA